MPAVAHPKPLSACIVLTGNPNCGKTTLFNVLTGLRAKVGNYAGVTVERKEGKLLGASAEAPATVLDLPGTYSLSPQSLDEQIARDVLFHRLAEVPAPNLVVIVVDASNLERNLYYATQVIELGYPTIVALNMIDVAADNSHDVDAPGLARRLGVTVVPLIASVGQGVPELKRAIHQLLLNPRPLAAPRQFCDLPAVFSTEVAQVADRLIQASPTRTVRPQSEALLLVSDEKAFANGERGYPEPVREAILNARTRLESAGIVWQSAVIEARYEQVSDIHRAVTTEGEAFTETFSDRLDRILTHKFWGVIIFMVLMVAMFQSIFTFAKLPMSILDAGVTRLGESVARLIPPGDLQHLLVDGVIAGVGAVVVFLPQICLLFLFIGLLEDTGYMARAAFLMDRLMSKVGLHGKSFIPMLSSFACAIPGIMATRTIESPKDRLATILVAPLMSCSARLTVYTLLIGACIPDQRVLGIFRLPGLTLFAMYLLGIIAALAMAWLLKKTLLKGEPPMLIMELPPYKRPGVKAVLRHMWDRSELFLRKAGTIILGINIILWFLASYPRSSAVEQQAAARRTAVTSAPLPPNLDARKAKEVRREELSAVERQAAAERLHASFAGRLGHWIEPAIAPLGFDWKIGIGVVASFAAREVFVSTMSTVYSVGAGPSEETSQTLAKTLSTQKRPDGSLLYTPLLGISLMVFYVFALQCVSTVAIVKRETNSWRWPLFQWIYMAVLAWVGAFITYQGGRLLGWQ